MVPAGAVLSASESVLHRAAWRNGTFRDTIDAVVLTTVEHSHTMPVHRSTIVLKTVLDIYEEGVAPIGFQLM